MMSPAWLLAQRHRWERLGDRFSGDHAKLDNQELLLIGLMVVGGAAVIVALARLAKWQENRRLRPNPARLFRDLCRAHGLSGAERKTLRALAEACGARQPAEVFLRPELFRRESALRHAGAQAAVIDRLRRKLFAGLE